MYYRPIEVYYSSQEDKKKLQEDWKRIKEETKTLEKSLADFLKQYAGLNYFEDVPFAEELIPLLWYLETDVRLKMIKDY